MAAERREAMEQIRRALSSLVNRQLKMGFQSWLGYVAGSQAQRGSMSKSLLHLIHRDLSRGWVSWLALVIGRANAFHAMQRSFVHWIMGAVLVAFGNWRRRCAVDTAHRAQLARYISVFSEPHARKAAMRLALGHWRREHTVGTRNAGRS